LPKSFAEGGSLIDIPKKNSTRQFLARNKLMGKIHLDSSMSQQEIFSEIRSSFRYPMNDYDEFRFRLLQPSGGEARCLMIPEVSSRYEWTAATVAGRNVKTPIYILAVFITDPYICININCVYMLYIVNG